ncbi:hypothetical protein V8G54_028880 [Vigna mungo]|uniref:Uncharacterized protein n=1 Tax=Vigna mungo TaxID=3915 RepID=A0AAQ3MSA0_VIGMU
MEEEDMDEILGVAYCVARFPSWPEGIFLGFLHCVVEVGTIAMASRILVPLMGGGNEEKAEMIETILFVAAINTVLQTWFGTRLPVVMGPSYTFLVPAVSIAFSKRMSVFEDPHQKYRNRKSSGDKSLVRLTDLKIFLVLEVYTFDESHSRGTYCCIVFSNVCWVFRILEDFRQILHCPEIALPTLFILVLFQTSFHLCRIRVPRPFKWGRPSFNAGDIFAMVSASLVATIESTGTFIAASRLGKATPIPPSVLGRGVGWLGIGTLLDGFFGTGTGSTASVVFYLTIRDCAIVSGKFGAFLASVPFPIVAAIYCILFAFVAASAGLGFLQFCNLNSYRSMFILGLSLCIGLSVPQYFNEYLLLPKHGRLHTGSTGFNNTVQVLLSSPATVAIIVAYFLDLILRRGDASARRDSGRHWWEKFRSFNQDTRSEEHPCLGCEGVNVVSCGIEA